MFHSFFFPFFFTFQSIFAARRSITDITREKSNGKEKQNGQNKQGIDIYIKVDGEK